MKQCQVKNHEYFSQRLQTKNIAGVFHEKYIEYNSEDDEQLSIKEYLEKIKPYLRDMTNDLKKSIQIYISKNKSEREH